MTIIVAASWGGEACIGCDSAGTDGWGMQHVYGSKLAKFPFGWLGFTASYRTLQAIRTDLLKAERVETETEAYALVGVIDSALQSAGWGRAGGDTLPTCTALGFLILSNRGRVWSIQSDLAILRHRRYAAVGSGYQVAQGALEVQGHLPVAEAVRSALGAACSLLSTCGRPIHRRTVSIA